MFKFESGFILILIPILLLASLVTGQFKKSVSKQEKFLAGVPQAFFSQPQHNEKAMERAMQDRSARIKFLSEVCFDRVILYALIAAEQNYAVKARLLPKVHEDDYYTVILNTAKRLAMADSGRITLPGLQKATQTDSTIKNKMEKETK